MLVSWFSAENRPAVFDLTQGAGEGGADIDAERSYMPTIRVVMVGILAHFGILSGVANMVLNTVYGFGETVLDRAGVAFSRKKRTFYILCSKTMQETA